MMSIVAITCDLILLQIVKTIMNKVSHTDFPIIFLSKFWKLIHPFSETSKVCSKLTFIESVQFVIKILKEVHPI